MRIRMVFLIVLLSTAGMLSQNGPVGGLDSHKIDNPQLSIDVAVFDAHGTAVTNLIRSDFDLLVDGVPQKIGSFTPVDTPYNVLLLLDCRDSTRDRLSLLTGAIAQFTNQLRPGDRMEIAVFGSEVHVVLDWNAERSEEIHIGANSICKNTDLYGALAWSTKEVLKVPGRRSVVVFSNGYQTEIHRQEMQVNGVKVQRIVPPIKDAEFQKVLKMAREGSTPFYIIAVDTDLNPGSRNAGPVQDLQQLRARVEQLAEVSGGRIVFPRESSEVVPLLLQIGRELGASYSLAFTPQHTRDGNYHTIDVRVRDENYHVQPARKGYTAN
jgi:VWFA-related protein